MLRGMSWMRGVRVNCVNFYFVDIFFLLVSGIVLLVGVLKVELGDVVDVGMRFMVDEGIRGRVLVVGLKMRVVEGEDGVMRLVVEVLMNFEGEGERV